MTGILRCGAFRPGDGVEEIVVERGGHAEPGHEVVHQLRAEDGLVDLAVAG